MYLKAIQLNKKHSFPMALPAVCSKLKLKPRENSLQKHQHTPNNINNGYPNHFSYGITSSLLQAETTRKTHNNKINTHQILSTTLIQNSTNILKKRQRYQQKTQYD